MKSRINLITLIFSLLVFVVVIGCQTTFAADKDQNRHPFKNQFFLDLGYGTLDRERTIEYNDTQYTSWSRGYQWNAKVGYRWRSGIRLELEKAQFRNDAQRNKIPNGLADAEAQGYAIINPMMVNINYDFGFRRHRFAPYVGYGIGKYTVNLHGLSSDNIRGYGAFLGKGTNVSLSDDAPAETCQQVLFGANYRLNRRIELHAGYRYFQGNDFDLEFPIINVKITPPGPIYRSIEFGVRYLF